MTEAMHSQMTAAELHERLTQAEAVLERIASHLPFAQEEGGLGRHLAIIAANYVEGHANV